MQNLVAAIVLALLVSGLPAASYAAGIDIISQQRSVRALLQSSGWPLPEPIDISASASGLGEFDATVVAFAMAPDGNYSTANATQQSYIGEDSVTAFLDANGTVTGGGGFPYVIYGSSTLEIVFRLDSEMNFALSGVFENLDSDHADAQFRFQNLDGNEFSYFGTVHDPRANVCNPGECPMDQLSISDSSDEFRLINDLFFGWNIEGLLPAGNYRIQGSSEKFIFDSFGSSVGFDFSVSPIPEPTAGLLFATGFGVVALATRRRAAS